MLTHRHRKVRQALPNYSFDEQLARLFAFRVLTFWKAAPADIPTLRLLAEKTWRVCYPPIIGSAQVEYMLGMMYSPDVIRSEMQGGVHWELASLGDQPIAFLSISAEADRRAKLNKLYLDPGLHGGGLGQQLISRACIVAGELSATYLWLQVNKLNERAIRAYRRAGFQVEREAVFEIGGGFVMDDFIMSRELASTDSL